MDSGLKLNGIVGRLALLSVCVGFTGCQFGFDVMVHGSAQALVIELEKPGLFASGPPLFQTLEVLLHRDHSAEVVWRLDAKGNPCKDGIARIVYGKAPEQYTAARPARPLREGRIYEVYAQGCGANGGTTFLIERGTVVDQKS